MGTPNALGWPGVRTLVPCHPGTAAQRRLASSASKHRPHLAAIAPRRTTEAAPPCRAAWPELTAGTCPLALGAQRAADPGVQPRGPMQRWPALRGRLTHSESATPSRAPLQGARARAWPFPAWRTNPLAAPEPPKLVPAWPASCQARALVWGLIPLPQSFADSALVQACDFCVRLAGTTAFPFRCAPRARRRGDAPH